MGALTRAAIVAEARTWRGTPFIEQQCKKGVGVDCGQLVLGVGCAAGAISESVADAVRSRFAGYTHHHGSVSEEDCLGMVGTIFSRVKVESVAAGDSVMLFADGSAITRRARLLHWGVLGDYRADGLSLIHCIPGRGVIEHNLPASWHTRIVAAFRYPGVE